jgi:hypothetical protein
MATLAVPPQAGDTVPLFASDEALSITLIADFEAIRKDRSDDPEDRPALLVLENGDTLEVELKPRGNFRRHPAICSLPPLRLDVEGLDLEGTVFLGQDKLKMVVSCRPAWDDYEELVLREMLVYKLYALFTDVAFQVRLAHVTFVDTAGDMEPFTRSAFFIERDEALARRVGGQLLEVPEGRVVRKELLHPAASTRIGIFQYLIGNSDWADTPSHNVVLVGLDGRVVPVPYDFDHAGLVDAPYAKPDPELPILTVQQRLYMGRCWPGRDPAADLRPFFDARPQIETLVRDFEPLDPMAREEVLDYLLKFFDIVSTPRRAQQQMFRDCRK